jgi:hypothetical protein
MKALLVEFLSYDPSTGVFRWKKRPANRVKVGAEAGSLDKYGYRVVMLRGKSFLLSRVAFVFMTGDWPKYEADHENGVRDDNRWLNLRDVTHGVNMQNRRKPSVVNTVGFLGVSIDGDKFRASISVETKVRFLGLFLTPLEAHHCYLEAKRKLHEGCTI